MRKVIENFLQGAKRIFSPQLSSPQLPSQDITPEENERYVALKSGKGRYNVIKRRLRINTEVNLKDKSPFIYVVMVSSSGRTEFSLHEARHEIFKLRENQRLGKQADRKLSQKPDRIAIRPNSRTSSSLNASARV